ISTFGAVKASYVTLSQEAHVGDTTLRLAAPAAGWRVGDKLFLPDTQQLDYGGDSTRYTPQWESLTIAAIAADGLSVTVTTPLAFNHLGARDSAGAPSYLPQVPDLT